MQTSPVIVVTDLRRQRTTRHLVDELYDAHLHQVQGMNISWAQPPEMADPDPGLSHDTNFGGVFHADIGVVLEPLSCPQRYRVHAEIGPHRSQAVELLLHEHKVR